MKSRMLYLLIIVFLYSCNRSEPSSLSEIKKTGDYSIEDLTLEVSGLNFPTVAIGRETKFNASDGPAVQITNNGICHPSVICIPKGLNGYKYWCAMTPRFGIISKQPDIDAYENPHVLCSNDGITWKEPSGINNPVDKSIKGPWNNYWSDTNIVYYHGKLHLYYRGCGFPNNFYNDKRSYLRAVVSKESMDGVNWSERKLLYASNTITPGVDDQSVMASPSIVESNGIWYCYDVVYSTEKNPYEPHGNQTKGFVFRRSDISPDGSFGAYSVDNICSFENRPWGLDNDPWHLEVVKYDNKYFMLICAGLVGKSNGDSLWLAYSEDGKKFRVLEKPLFTKDTYKSGILPISNTKDGIVFKIYQSEKSTGKINLYNLKLKKI